MTTSNSDRGIAIAARVDSEVLRKIDLIAFALSKPGKVVSRHRLTTRLIQLGIQAVESKGIAQVRGKHVMLCLCPGNEGCSSCPGEGDMLPELAPDSARLPGGHRHNPKAAPSSTPAVE